MCYNDKRWWYDYSNVNNLLFYLPLPVIFVFFVSICIFGRIINVEVSTGWSKERIDVAKEARQSERGVFVTLPLCSSSISVIACNYLLGCFITVAVQLTKAHFFSSSKLLHLFSFFLSSQSVITGVSCCFSSSLLVCLSFFTGWLSQMRTSESLGLGRTRFTYFLGSGKYCNSISCVRSLSFSRWKVCFKRQRTALTWTYQVKKV